MRICCAGEVMIEMASLGQDGLYQRGIAGDTYNTAVYLSREGLDVSYLTRLGDDPLSDDIIQAMAREKIDTSAIARCPGRQPGLYLIDNDARGERFFSYWRTHSPARELFEETVNPGSIDAFYFSGITLAVTRSGSDQLLDLLARLKNRGAKVLFDPNYRASLWDSTGQAKATMDRILPFVDIALPTLEDETALRGMTEVAAAAAHYQSRGVREVVVKAPDLTSHVYDASGEITRQRAPKVSALDTTGAGDAFSAAYLATRLRGGTAADALANAQQLATQVVQHRGAILPSEEE